MQGGRNLATTSNHNGRNNVALVLSGNESAWVGIGATLLRSVFIFHPRKNRKEFRALRKSTQKVELRASG